MEDFCQKLREACDTGGRCVAMCRDTACRVSTMMHNRKRFLEEFDVQEVLMFDSFLTYLLRKHGDGIYDVNIYGRYGEVVAEFEFAVGRLPKPEDPEYKLMRQMLETVKTFRQTDAFKGKTAKSTDNGAPDQVGGTPEPSRVSCNIIYS